MFEAGLIFKLNTISILPQEINISPENMTVKDHFPIYKLEVWLGKLWINTDKILLDETYDIKISEKKDSNANKSLLITNKVFRYFAR
jgi:hypothetical protein